MALHSEFYFPSGDGKTQIHAEQWLPEGEVKAVLQISHGVSEYVGRYAPFAEFLTKHGFAVIGGDHLGHGKSVAEGAPRIFFGESDGWRHVVDDIARLRALGKEKFPNVPYFIMGHSMGSFIVRTYLIRYPGDVEEQSLWAPVNRARCSPARGAWWQSISERSRALAPQAKP